MEARIHSSGRETKRALSHALYPPDQLFPVAGSVAKRLEERDSRRNRWLHKIIILRIRSLMESEGRPGNGASATGARCGSRRVSDPRE